MQLRSLADVSATSQHVDSNTSTLKPLVHLDLDKVNAKANIRDAIAGYIFMCNTGTKPDCFTYRVFGLPASRVGAVEKIKPNTKLFLFDVDVKLLYGLYVAESNGQWALEPYAFGGRFPAQVKFSIARDCLPVPEVAFKDVIKENYYSGSKFKQELNDEQVNKLVSLFRPIAVPVPSPQRPSLCFLDAVTSVYHKYVEPSQQVTRDTFIHHERSVPKFPSASYAESYNGQNPMPQLITSPVSPAVALSSSRLSSSLTASQWVAMAANPLNAEVQASNFTLPSRNESGASIAHMSYNGSDIREVGYGYIDQAYHGSHQALSVITNQGVNNRPIHADEMHSNSVSSYYTQNQVDSAMPQTWASQSSGTSVDNAYMYNNRNHPAFISYSYNHTQGDPSLTQSLPSVSDGAGTENSDLHYNGANSATLAYGYGN